METFFLVPVFERYSKWLIYELSHAYELLGKSLIITNVKDEKLKRELRNVGVLVFEEDFLTFARGLPRPLIVLDPRASEPLLPEEAVHGTIIVGGILGHHPPRGRTSILISRRISKYKEYVLFRNIGEKQFTIDGALAVAFLVSKGKRLSEIEFVEGFKLTQKFLGFEREIELPYMYPKINGRPFISEKLIRYLLEG